MANRLVGFNAHALAHGTCFGGRRVLLRGSDVHVTRGKMLCLD